MDDLTWLRHLFISTSVANLTFNGPDLTPLLMAWPLVEELFLWLPLPSCISTMDRAGRVISIPAVDTYKLGYFNISMHNHCVTGNNFIFKYFLHAKNQIYSPNITEKFSDIILCPPEKKEKKHSGIVIFLSPF